MTGDRQAFPEEGRTAGPGLWLPQATGDWRTSDSGLVVPTTHETERVDPLEFAGAYVALSSYVGGEESSESLADRLVARALTHYSREQLLGALIVLLKIVNSGDIEEVRRDYERVLLEPEQAEAIRRFEQGVPNAFFLARQPLLGALRLTLLHGLPRDEVESEGADSFLPYAAILLSHAVADQLTPDDPTPDEQVIGGLPATVFGDVLSASLFNAAEDPLESMARTFELWSHYSDAAAAEGLRASPDSLLRESLGCSLEEFMAVGFLVYAHNQALEPQLPPLPLNLEDVAIEADSLGAALATLSAGTVSSTVDLVWPERLNLDGRGQLEGQINNDR